MSTPCIIAAKIDKGYLAIYCHNDGYHDYMWPMLIENYNSENLAFALISKGDASCIKKKLEPETTTHSFHTPEKDVCVFYHRDREEPWDFVKPEFYKSESKLAFIQPYVYVFEDGRWKEL